MADLAQKAGGTYADIEALPEHEVGELVAGTLYVSPRPAPRNARVHLKTSADLLQAFDDGDGGPGGWLFLPEPELHLGDDVLVPDLAGWRRERLPALPANRAHIDVAPDWVAEIASPRTRRFDRMIKLPRYHRANVGHVWLIEVDSPVIDVFRWAPDNGYLDGTYSEGEDVRIPPFDAVGFDTRAWWSS